MHLGPLSAAATDAIEEAMALVPRIQARDHTVWGEDPTELADRLGWLDAPARADAGLADELRRIASGVAERFTDVLVVGMGGSSLYPEVLTTTYVSAVGSPRLWVLDSTDPAAVLAIEEDLPWGDTLLVPASKSGGTLEMVCHLERFWSRLVDARGHEAARAVVPITDPGSGLDARAQDEGYRAVVHGQPDVGGRFSALSPFGLFPAALLGLDLDEHLAPARAQLEAAASTDPQVNAPVVLGAVLAAAARSGRDKLTLLLPDEISSFGLWVEQLVAESTGKHGVGIVPVIGERPGTATFGDDRIVVALGEHDGLDELAAAGTPVVQLPWDGPGQLAGEVVRWEMATAVVGALLGINPFDQPDVAAAKAATNRMLDTGEDLPPPDDPAPLLAAAAPGDVIHLLAFVTPGSETEREVRAAADRLRARTGVPVCVGIGPRYLHSTGQLHKGGPDHGIFLLTVGDDPRDVSIPGRDHGFSRLKRAQAAGDLATLREAGRRVAHVDVHRLGEL
jgi:transaldolase/glucose-6-phosphate isomerase